MSVCHWCGKEYTKTHNRQVYCSEQCQKYGYLEKARIRKVNYRKKYKNFQSEKRLGSYAASLGPHRVENFYQEYEIVHKEVKSFGLNRSTV
jgi:predicted nucleic acid-binding Zn ribbon protein